MELNLIIESKNFDDNESLKELLNINPCKHCLLGVGLSCVERKYCRWRSHREIFIKKEVKEMSEHIESKEINWNEFAQALKDQFGESLVNEDDDENDPLNYWLQDATVADITDFVKNYFNKKSS